MRVWPRNKVSGFGLGKYPHPWYSTGNVHVPITNITEDLPWKLSDSASFPSLHLGCALYPPYYTPLRTLRKILFLIFSWVLYKKQEKIPKGDIAYRKSAQVVVAGVIFGADRLLF